MNVLIEEYVVLAANENPGKLEKFGKLKNVGNPVNQRKTYIQIIEETLRANRGLMGVNFLKINQKFPERKFPQAPQSSDDSLKPVIICWK